MSCITVYRRIIHEGVSVFRWICTKLICNIYLSLYMAITEIMCLAFRVLLLEISKLLYILLLFCLYIEILALSSLFKCLIAIKCSESRVETLQILFFFLFRSFKITSRNILLFLQKYPDSISLLCLIVQEWGLGTKISILRIWKTYFAELM